MVKDKSGVYLTLVGVIILCLSYLWFILFAAPNFISKRAPYNVTPLIQLYNIFHVIVCFLCVLRGFQLGFNFSNILQCQRFEFLTHNEKFEIYLGVWMYLGLRIFAFLETIFFVLRKKFDQVTFLHILHQIGFVIFIWLFLASEAGELMSMTLEINSILFLL